MSEGKDGRPRGCLRRLAGLFLLLLSLLLAVGALLFLALNLGVIDSIARERFFIGEIETAARRESLDPRLVAAVVWSESGFDTSAVSEAGAVGLMQVMPSTAGEILAEMGYSDISGIDLRDPGTNLMIGCRYLSDLMDRFGDRDLALAAYNSGPRAVNNWIENGETDTARFPLRETREYVDRVNERIRSIGMILEWRERLMIQ